MAPKGGSISRRCGRWGKDYKNTQPRGGELKGVMNGLLKIRQ